MAWLAAPASPASAAPPLTTSQIIHPNIDVQAQKAIAALVAEGGDAAVRATLILGAVQSGAIGGIYLANQGVPALRAQKFGTNWWSLHPTGVDGVVLPPHPSEPNTTPILVLRKSVANKATARKNALNQAFATFSMMMSGSVQSCSGGITKVSFVAGGNYCAASSFVAPYVEVPDVIQLVLDRAGPWNRQYVFPKQIAPGVEPICARSLVPYTQCKTRIGKPAPQGGNKLHPLVPASTIEPGGGKAKPLTKARLMHIMSAQLQPGMPGLKGKRENLENALPKLRETFAAFGIDTVRAQAHYLGHYAGELGGNPGKFGIVEAFTGSSCPESNNAVFLGRGPLQVTCRVNYTMALAYMEHRHDQRVIELVNAALQSQPTQVWSAFMNAINDPTAKTLARTHKAIKTNVQTGGEFEHGFLLSGAYWHAAGCGQDMRALSKVANVGTFHFTKGQPGSKCISGGGTSTSMTSRAAIKACVYNVAMQTLSTGQLTPHKCINPKTKFKPAASNSAMKRPKIRRFRKLPFPKKK